MNRGIYATASGMVGAQQLLDTIAHNLANSNTVGFKRDRLAFSDALIQQIHANGGAGARLGELGSGPGMAKSFTVFERGSMTATGNPLDIAIESDGVMFAIQTESGVRFTRNGAFTLNAERELVTTTGEQVLDEALQPIQLIDEKVEVQPDGSIASESGVIAKVGLFSGTFVRSGSGDFSSEDATLADDATVRSGALESSNVNPIEEMILMVGLNRSFEMAQRSIIQQDELTKALIQSLRD